jgi:hypothetical protein
MANPAPATPTSAFRKKEATILQSCLTKGIVIALMTDSINMFGSVDGRYGAWWGGLQRNMDAIYQVPRIQQLLNARPVPVVKGLPASEYTFKALSFESHSSKYSVDVGNLFNMSAGGDVGTSALQHGAGFQATFQGKGTERDRTDFSTAMECYVATENVGDAYTVTVDGIVLARVVATVAGLQWRKHEKINMAPGNHTMIVTFTNGTCIYHATDSHIGSERSGVRVYNMGRSGVSMNAMSRTGAGGDKDQKWNRVFPLLADDGKSGVDIGVLTLATNNGGDSEAAFEILLEEAVEGFFATNPNAILHIMYPAQPKGQSLEMWQGRHRAAHRVASRHEWVSVDTLSTVEGDTKRIPQINYDPVLIQGLHPKSPLLLGDNLEYGYAKLSTALITGSYFTGAGTGTGGSTGGETGGETGGGTAPTDTTAPTIAVITGDNLTLNRDGSFTWSADITDSQSAMGLAVVRSVAGDLLGNLVKTTGNRYELTLTWKQARAFLKDGETAIRWFIVAYDEFNNRAASGARNLTVQLPVAVSPAPTISNVVASGFDVAGSSISIAADVTHAVGVAAVPVYVAGVYVADLVKPAAGNRWTAVLARNLFEAGTNYYLEAQSVEKTRTMTAPATYTLVGKDTTAPTGEIKFPLTNTTLDEVVVLEAAVTDAESGVRYVDWYVGEKLLTNADFTTADRYRSTISRQAILDLDAGNQISARMEDWAGNVQWTRPIYFTAPPIAVQGYLFQPWWDSATALPAEGVVLDALDARILQVAAAVAGNGGPPPIGYDTDGAPYLTDAAGTPGSQIQFDTDGAPYLP